MAVGANGRMVVGDSTDVIWGRDTDTDEDDPDEDFLVLMFDTGESATRSPALTPAPSSDTAASSLDDTPAPSVSTTAVSASNTAAPLALDTVMPSPDGTAALSVEEEPSSNDTPVIAGVASAVAGIILIGLGVFFILRTSPVTAK